MADTLAHLDQLARSANWHLRRALSLADQVQDGVHDPAMVQAMIHFSGVAQERASQLLRAVVAGRSGNASQ